MPNKSLKGDLSIQSPDILLEMYDDGFFDIVGQANILDSAETLAQEIAVDIFKACVGEGVNSPGQMVFDVTLCHQIFDRLQQVYKPRSRSEMPNPHIGYIYVIEKPFPQRKMGDDKNVIWVGVSEKPWVTMERATYGLGGQYFVGFMKEIKKYSQENGYAKFTWRKEEVVEAYLRGEAQPINEVDSSMLWLPWYIIDDNFAKQVSTSFYVDKLREEGHPLRNGSVGRPRKPR